MRTRKELVEAYLFVTRRIISAMMSTNPDALELPMRRSRYSVLGGTLLALLIFAGFWVIGMFMPTGNDNWKEEGAIVLNTDTGTTYVYMQSTLFPVKNMASAQLIAADSDVTEASNDDLEDEPRGWELGIPDAPPAIPEADSLVGMPWQVCSAEDFQDETERTSHVVISASPADAEVGEQALIVEAADVTYLLWNDRKHLVVEDTSLRALGMDASDAIEVDPVFASAVETGPDLVAPKIDDEDEEAEPVGGYESEYGDYFTAGGREYVLTVDGLARIGAVSSALLRDGESAGGTPISASDVDDVGTTVIEPVGFPQDIPDLIDVDDDATVCAVADGSDVSIAVHTDPPKAITAPTVYAAFNEDDSTDTAEHVWLPGGTGTLVRDTGVPDAEDGTVYLITDQGTKHALTADAVDKLGFGDVEPTPVPATLLPLVPTGPALDPEEVRSQVPFDIG